MGQFNYLYMDLRVICYVESKEHPGQLEYMLCQYKGSTLRVRANLMTNQDRHTEWNFGDPYNLLDQNIIITARYGRGVPEFLNFRPDLKEPSKETLR